MIDRIAELRKFVKDMEKDNTLVVPCREFVYPEHTIVRLPNPEDPRVVSVAELVSFLGIPFEKLTEVYEYKGEEYRVEKQQPRWKNLLIKAGLAQSEMETRTTQAHFTGQFTDRGKQHLADLLNKTIEYYHQPTSAPLFDLTTKEVYSPIAPEDF